MKIGTFPPSQRKRNRDKIKGFTLIELVISSTIFLIIISLVFSITGTGRVSWTIASARMHVHTQARQASSFIREELILSNDTRVFIEDGGTSIRFGIPLVTASGELSLSGGGDLRWGDGTNEAFSIKYVPVVQMINGTPVTNLVRQRLSDTMVVVEERVIARDLDAANPPTVVLLSGRYELTYNFILASYMGRNLPTPITHSLTIAITPRN
jgi:prepilin-type N-terminal cleavage/methylation domain-containing protein